MSLITAQKPIVHTIFAQIADAGLLASRHASTLACLKLIRVQSRCSQDMMEQRQKLMQTMAVVVNALDDLSPLIPAVQNLGKRHMTYGVHNPAH